jgi:putative membrane protein
MEIKKRMLSRLAVLLLSAAAVLILVLASSGTGTEAETETEAQTQETVQSEEKQEENKKSAAQPEKDKTETVYVKADAEGTVRETTVEAVLKGIDGEEDIPDVSNLTDIRNTKGDEEYTLGADGSLLWENHGESISYKGKSVEEVPVTVHISYELDGQKVSPEQLAGKSGKLRMRFDYENHTYGGDETPIPFLVMSVLLLPEEVFSNVEITNGKLISMDGQSMAVGYAYPGIADYLELGNYEPTEEVEIPEYVELTADVTEFELAFTATIVTTGSLEELDTEDLDEVDEFIDSMADLTDASQELVNGAGKLLDGMKEFDGYLKEYVDGAGELKDGIKALKEGAALLNENNGALTEGAKGLQTGLEELAAALKKIELADVGAEGTSETEDVTQTLTLDAVMGSVVEDALEAAVKAALEANPDLELSEETLELMQKSAADSVAENEDLLAYGQSIQEYNRTVAETMAALSGMGETLTALQTGVGQLAEGSAQLTEGVTAYTQGVGQLYEGTEQLYDGAKQLTSAGDELYNGFGEVTEGTQSLKNGMEEFDREGIRELGKLTGEELETLVARLRELKAADESYRNFSGIREGQTGSVCFIIETDGIEKNTW